MNGPYGAVFPPLLAAWLIAGCSGDGATEPAPSPPAAPIATTIVIAPAAGDTIDAVGFTRQFSAQVIDQEGRIMATAPISWSTDNASIVSVSSSSGLATGRGAGTTSLTATSDNAVASVPVTVRPPADINIVSASQLQTNIGEWTVTVQFRNAGGSGTYYFEAWSLRTSPSGQHRLWGASTPVDVGPHYEETLAYAIPTSGSKIDWLIVYTRDPGSAANRQSDRFDFP